MIPFLISFSLSSIVLFILFLTFSIRKYQDNNKSKYTFANHFIYELKHPSNSFGFIIFILSLVLLFGYYFRYLFSNHIGIYLPISVIGMLASIFIGLLFLIPISRLKQRIFIFVILFSTTLINSLLNSYNLIKDIIEEMNVIKLILGIIYSLIAIYLLTQLLNPKLTFDLKMDVDSSDGETSYKRYKKYPLIVIEWSLIFINYFILILNTITFMI